METSDEIKYNDFDCNTCDIDILQYREFCSRDTSGNLKDRLRGQLAFWRNTLQDPEFVLSMIEAGSLSTISATLLFNNLSPLKHLDFVEEAVAELLHNHCITEHTSPPLCVNPLTVAEGKKLRLVIDLRHVNQHIFKNKFIYEDLRSLSQVIEEGH